MAPVLEGKSIGSDQKTVLKGDLLIWRTKNGARDQDTVQTQGFNLLSNQSKLVPRKLDLGPSSEVGLSLLNKRISICMEHYTLDVVPKVVPKLRLSCTPYPLFQWHLQSKEILLNLNMECWNLAFNAQRSRVIIIVVQVGAVKI
jgi:hypothetical protein